MIVQAIKTISRARLNFRRLPIWCTTLCGNLMQASKFGGTFDQLFLWIFYEILTDASLLFLYHGAKKSKRTKNSNQGGPAWHVRNFDLNVARLSEKETEILREVVQVFVHCRKYLLRGIPRHQVHDKGLEHVDEDQWWTLQHCSPENIHSYHLGAKHKSSNLCTSKVALETWI